MRVAYQGEPGAFSEAAVLRLLPDAEPRPYPTFDEVFDAVGTGAVNLGVVPIENSIGGSIHRNYDLLVERVGRSSGDRARRSDKARQCLVGDLQIVPRGEKREPCISKRDCGAKRVGYYCSAGSEPKRRSAELLGSLLDLGLRRAL